jgi:hypothetical protein
MFRAPARESGLGAFIQLFWDRAPARESGLGAFIQLFWDRAPARESGIGTLIQLCWDSSQASVAHLPHPVIAYSWDTALDLVAYPVISYD